MVSFRVVLMASGVLFMALAMKASVPLVFQFLTSQLPLLYTTFHSLLKPPYLYIIINGIIITIVASSRFNRDPKEPQAPANVSVDLVHEAKIPTPEIQFSDPQPLVLEPIEVKTVVVDRSGEEEEEDDPEERVISMSTWTPPKRSDSPEFLLPPTKPLVSSRFGHRKSVKASPEAGRALKVSKPKRHETMENTWKMITEGRSMPLTRHMKKSDTWENHGRQFDFDNFESSMVKKSETFKDRTNQPAPAVKSPLRKEPSLGQDELNRRVEAFINKFNEEMRLQREESLNQYKEMINRGSHF
ncbi:hypothetical protein UlMin_011772 [Ulmus minor]